MVAFEEQPRKAFCLDSDLGNGQHLPEYAPSCSTRAYTGHPTRVRQALSTPDRRAITPRVGGPAAVSKPEALLVFKGFERIIRVIFQRLHGKVVFPYGGLRNDPNRPNDLGCKRHLEARGLTGSRILG
jgi:hypothetical protein